MSFDREVYFDSVRESLFSGSLTQEQVDGQVVILSVWEFVVQTGDLRWLAYMLATTYHECAQRMWPITEMGSQEYLESKEYYPYIGRGFVQLTWEDNYRKAGNEIGRDLVNDPDLALDCLIATRVLYHGMSLGWFTGRKLDQYFNDSEDDPVNARQIINGNDCDDQIARYHDKFLEALKASWIEDEALKPEPDEEIPSIVADLTVTGEVKAQLLVNGVLVWETEAEVV